MIHADEIQHSPGQIPFSTALVERAQIRLDSEVVAAKRLSAARPWELNLSGSQVLVGCVSALCTLSLFLWTMIKLWIFEP